MNENNVKVVVRFITIMQKYSEKRELELDVSRDPEEAVNYLLNKFNIPWKDNLEKSTRIFINGKLYKSFIQTGNPLNPNDIIAFIPISGGG